MPIPVGCAQVTMFFTGSNMPNGAACTIGFDITGAAGTPNGVGVDYNAVWLGTGIQARIASAVNYSGCLVKFGPDSTGPSALVPTTINGAGGTGASPNVTWLVQKVTAVGGRAGRGRWYLPGMPESVVGGDGVLDATARANMQGDINELIAAWAAEGLVPMVLHGEGSPISVPSQITALNVDTRAATQRRRLRP